MEAFQGLKPFPVAHKEREVAVWWIFFGWIICVFAIQNQSSQKEELKGKELSKILNNYKIETSINPPQLSWLAFETRSGPKKKIEFPTELEQIWSTFLL